VNLKISDDVFKKKPSGGYVGIYQHVLHWKLLKSETERASSELARMDSQRELIAPD